MAYIGKLPNTTGKDAGPSLKLDDISSGFNGNTKVFDLTVAGTSVDPHVNNTQIYLSGVHQLPGSAYTLSGSQIVFTAAPSSSLSFHGAMIGDATLFTPNQDTIEPAAFTDNARTALSGSLGVNGSLIRSLTADNISGSFSQTHLSSKISGIISGAAQLPSGVVSASVLSSPSQGTIRLATNGVNTDVDSGLQAADSPTFAAGTITGNLSVGGTLTAQEIHTEFTSASIMFSSGSTKFGDTIDDTHEVTGSMTMSGSVTVNDGALTVTDNVDFNGDLDVDGTTNLDNTDIDGTLTVDGGNIVFNEDSADQDFRVESNGNANMLFVDGGANAVGIGIGAPINESSGVLLHIADTGGSNAAHINLSGGDGAAGSQTGKITFSDPGDADDGVAFISSNIEGSGANPGGNLNFFTSTDGGSSNNSVALRMFISGSGNVGIGTSQPDAKLKVEESTAGANVEIKMRALNDSSAGRTFAITADPDARSITMGEAGQFVIKSNSATTDNVGIGVVPEDTNTSHSALQVGGNFVLSSFRTQGASGEVDLFHNAFFNQAGNVVYISTDEATRYRQGSGVHSFSFAASGTAGATISFTEAMRVHSDGNVGIGTNSPDAKLHVSGQSKFQTDSEPVIIIAGTESATDHTAENSALCIDFRNLSTTNGVASGLVGLDKDGLELTKILLVTDNHDDNDGSIRFHTSTDSSSNHLLERMRIADNGVLLSGNRSDNLLKASLSHAKVVASGTCTTTFTATLGAMNDWHMIIFNVYSSSTTTNSVTQGQAVAFGRVMHSSSSGFAGTSITNTVTLNYSVSVANASGNSFDIVVATTNSGAIEQITHVDVIAGGNGITSLTVA